MKTISENVKNAFKQPTTQRKGVILVNGNYYDIYNVKYYADCYDDGKVIGNAIASQLDFDIPYMPKFDTFRYFDCIWVDNGYEYIDFGNFTVFDEQDQDTFNKHITAFDNLIKFNKPFEDVGGYPKTLYSELSNICIQAGVTLANSSIPNGNFIVVNNQFVNGESLKTVLKQICAISGNYAIVKNNILYLQLKNQTSEVINNTQHEPIDWKRRSYGINQVIIGDSQVVGEYVIREDSEDIALNGVHKLEILDNLFANSQDKRSALIDELFNQVRGFGYIPFEMKGEWLSYLDIGDTINIDGTDTILLRVNSSSPDSLNTTMSAPAIIDSSIDYVDNTDDVNNRLKRTEISVDKQNQKITSVVSKVDGQDEKISQITQTVDEINSKISEISDITTSGESSYAYVNLNEVNESNPIQLIIRPISDNISYLYPHGSKNLFDKDNANVLSGYLDPYGTPNVITGSSSGIKTIYIPCEPNKTYTLSKAVEPTTASNRLRIATTSVLPQVGGSISDYVGYSDGTTNTSLSITTGATAKYLVATIYYPDASMTFDEMLASIQIERGDTATTYEPYYSGLYPSSNLYSTIRKIRFHNNTSNEDFDYILPDDLLYYDSNNYDEFYLDFDSQTCQVTKKCKYNADGSVSLLSSPRIDTYAYPSEFAITDGNYTISILSYNTGYIFVRLMAKNIYTTQFYTKAETNSLINQTSRSIDLSVNQKLSNYSTTAEMNSAINIKANEITSSVSEIYATKETTNTLSSRITQNASSITSEVTRATQQEGNLSSRIEQTATGISLSVNNGSTTSGITIRVTKEDGSTQTATGTIEMTGLVKFSNLNDGTTTISGSNIKTGTINGNVVNVTNINASNITSGTLSANKISGGSITASSINLGNGKFGVTTGGVLTATSGTVGGWTLGTARLSATGTHSTYGAFGMALDVNSGVASAIWVGSDLDTSNAVFRVRKDGKLFCTSAEIKGEITSGSTISGSTINGSNINVGNSNSGGAFDYYNGEGYLVCGKTTRHPYISALNVGHGSGGINFYTGTSKGNVGSFKGGIFLQTNWNLEVHAETNDLVLSGYHVKLAAREGYVYASRNGGSNYKVSTESGDISSLSLKENIKKFDNTEYENAYKLLQNIDMYRFNYKYDGISENKNEYGFIIDYIEKNKDYDKFLYFEDEKANVTERNDLDYLIDENSKNVIDFKKYNENNIIKYLLTVIKSMQIKIDKLEREK